MAQACRQHAASIAPFIDTVNTARDLDRIRQALRRSTITFYGVSYGTVLGSVYASLFPHRVATMVLDGAVDLNASLTQQAIQEAPAAERSLTTSWPAAPRNRHAHWERILDRSSGPSPPSLSHHPLPAPGSGDPIPSPWEIWTPPPS